MTTLEAIIIKLTHETPSGEICRIGDAFFTVRYCSDIWEWDYLGETYWDAEDLAEAIVRGGTAVLKSVPSLSKRGKDKGGPSKAKHPKMFSPPEPGRSSGRMVSDRPSLGTGPAPPRSGNPQNSRAFRGHAARSRCGTPCPCATPCATPQGYQVVRH
jgi:hypothetical protein